MYTKDTMPDPQKPHKKEIPTIHYKRMGNKTLLLMILSRSGPLLGLLFLGIILSAIEPYLPQEIVSVVNILLGPLFAIWLFLFILVCIIGLLEYTKYSVLLAPTSFHVRRGVLTINEIGSPYRRIQDIKVNRTIIDQLWGISTVIINIIGEEQDIITSADRTIITLPFLDKTVARDIHTIMLARSGVEVEVDLLRRLNKPQPPQP